MAGTITIPGMFLTGTHAARPAANAVGGGSIYSCTTHSLIYQSDGSSWSTWATLGTAGAIVDPMTTRGDVIVRNASNVTARLAIGSSGKVLQSDGTDVSWQTPSAGSALTVKDEGSNLDTAVTSIDFVGAGVTATNVSHAVTVTIPGGGGGSSALAMIYVSTIAR